MFWVIPTPQVLSNKDMPKALHCIGDWHGCRSAFNTSEGKFICWDAGEKIAYRAYCCYACVLYHCDANTMTRH